MSSLLICAWFLVANLHSLLGMARREHFTNGQIRSRSWFDDRSDDEDTAVPVSNGTYVSNKCLTQSTSIDRPGHKADHNDQRQAPATAPQRAVWWTIAAKTTVQHSGSDGRESGEISDQSSSLTSIQVVFTIPYAVIEGSIINQTVFITDAQSNQLLATSKYVCVNSSSFVVNYLTNKPLPHNVCLYLVLKRTSTTVAREIFTCRTVEKDPGDHNDQQMNEHSGRPTVVFIVSQGILILMTMFFISLVHTVRKKRLVNRISQHLLRSLTTTQTLPDNMANEMIELRQRNPRSRSIEERVLAASDLTTTQNDRTRTDRSLFRISELTQRLHA